MDRKVTDIKLTPKQKEVVLKMQEGYFIYKNLITPMAAYDLSKDCAMNWGSIHGQIVTRLLRAKIIEDADEKVNFAVAKYQLTESGRQLAKTLK